MVDLFFHSLGGVSLYFIEIIFIKFDNKREQLANPQLHAVEQHIKVAQEYPQLILLDPKWFMMYERAQEHELKRGEEQLREIVIKTHDLESQYSVSK